MSKKSKKNLQKILAKRQRLQQLSSIAPSRSLPSISEERLEVPTETKTLTQPQTYAHSRELIRTLISIGVTLVLLASIVIFDQKRNDLESFGNWLYQTLRLNQ
jgi:hypothetical protein